MLKWFYDETEKRCHLKWARLLVRSNRSKKPN